MESISEYQTGQQDARNVYDPCEELPTQAELEEARRDVLAQSGEYSDTDAAFLASWWAAGWLVAATQARQVWQAERAAELDEEWAELDAIGREGMGDDAWDRECERMAELAESYGLEPR